MIIEKDKVVAIDYTLKNDAGEVIDSSEGREPLTYLQGHGNIIEGLEEALEGKKEGDEINVSISPEKGYGTRNEDMVRKADRSQFQQDVELKAGMQFQAEVEGHTYLFTITKVEGDEVVLDGNHPLAGETLHFHVKVKDIRAAETEELAHGHVHGPGGHHH